ncbi:hypothetical protein [Legionella longbeachae]|uniref:Uncharacterized protein n=1 Tax=Legionella longbeachae serogroup 1 (strain NSW150) TaxID=661367 RepID=D3HK76_LEGLN|nr:hypothetical protein [Legionella longbeachae]VEE03357.1 Uncharacterised protein [Legionella oakridgensis]HBD7397636.1 hypothetical protein [Legionella pneumophila]ARB93746.1 hypothetical protein A6J40_16885 [Legionella longbeachae]ARM33114.1 hypothetical protein B0B39_06080 [Legionella longbeachae]QIN33073.1 hypothetical protein GCB94_13430 [Legionella longbeachae]
MLCGKNQTKNIIKEKTTAKTIETVKKPKNDKLNSNQFFNKCHVKGEENKSKNIGTRQYHTSHKLQKPEQEVIDYLHTTTKGLDKQVAQKQKDGGYQPDDWGMATFGQIFKKNGIKIVVQSLVNGSNSLITALNKPLNEITIDDLRYLNALYMNGQFPKGASLYFASPNALKTGLIHPEYLSNKDWKHMGQVSPAFCEHTGNIKRNLRETAGIFRIPDWLNEVPLAVSEVKANSKLKMTLTNGTDKEYEIGQGGEIQIYVSPEIMGVLHREVIKVIYQTQNHHGIKKAVRDKDGVVVEFAFSGRNELDNYAYIDTGTGLKKAESTFIATETGEIHHSFK